MQDANSSSTRQEVKPLDMRPWARRPRDVPTFDGPKAKACSNFVPTRQEIEQLARYWMWELIHVSFHSMLNGMGMAELQTREVCKSRLDAVEAVLGKQTAHRIYADCVQDYERFVGPEEWRKFETPILQDN